MTKFDSAPIPPERKFDPDQPTLPPRQPAKPQPESPDAEEFADYPRHDPAADTPFPAAPAIAGPATVGPPGWPVLLAGTVAIGLAAVVQLAVLVLLFLVTNDWQFDRARFVEWARLLANQPWGPVILLVPGQSVFLLTAVIGGGLSGEPLGRRLGLVGGRLSWRHWWLLIAATPLIGIVSAIIVNLLFPPSNNMEAIQAMVEAQRGHGWLAVAACLTILPGLCEEWLFRGLIQRRLMSRMTPALAIVCTAALFAAAHLEPLHVLMVLPLGIWLGVVAYLTDSTWAAVLAHTANNAVSMLLLIAA